MDLEAWALKGPLELNQESEGRMKKVKRKIVKAKGRSSKADPFLSLSLECSKFGNTYLRIRESFSVAHGYLSFIA